MLKVDGYPPPDVFRHYAWAVEVHGENLSEVLRQYRSLPDAAPMVIKDLEIFCYVRESTSAPDISQHEMNIREGMRKAFLRLWVLAELDDFTIGQLEEQYTMSAKQRERKKRARLERDKLKRLAKDDPKTATERETKSET